MRRFDDEKRTELPPAGEACFRAQAASVLLGAASSWELTAAKGMLDLKLAIVEHNKTYPERPFSLQRGKQALQTKKDVGRFAAIEMYGHDQTPVLEKRERKRMRLKKQASLNTQNT
ncbi:hypothetical protein ACFL2C_04160 [Patescibacteria group bacterium]